MKTKELIACLKEMNPESDICINTNDNTYEISCVSINDTESGNVNVIEVGSLFYEYLEPNADIKKLINMRSDWTDHWGEDLLWTVLDSMNHGDSRFPKELEFSLKEFQNYSKDKQVSIIRHVLQIRPGEGYDY